MRAWGVMVVGLLGLGAGCDDGAAMDAGTDAGIADAGSADAGVDASGPTCTEDLRSPLAGVQCSIATATCAQGCADATCAEDCFAADPSPSCLQCWTVNQLACWNRNGCQPQWNCLSQCILANCPSPPTGACIGANCATEDQAYADCFEPLRQMCLERTVDCLPM
ncbi:MAG: hypothetical protein AB7S26_42325 [Sandaracinaceae bacterium]